MQKRLLVRWIFAPLFPLLLVMPWNGNPAIAQDKPEKSLYVRIGGYDELPRSLTTSSVVC